MISRKAWCKFTRVYNHVHAALWATLFVFVIYTVVIVTPQLVAAKAALEREQARKIAAENSSYCVKWGMPAGTHRHTLCTLDLQQLRANVAQRLTGDEF
ncbi:MAG TPA: hypothetical protein VFX37_03875 [Pseudolabrys sp.]|nr:hypothetical protein [Pseudolabrys sp.]